MTTFQQTRAAIRAALDEGDGAYAAELARDARPALVVGGQRITAHAKAEGRQNLTADEQRRFDAIMRDVAELDGLRDEGTALARSQRADELQAFADSQANSQRVWQNWAARAEGAPLPTITEIYGPEERSASLSFGGLVRAGDPRDPYRHPLAVTEEQLDEVQDSIEQARLGRELRATVTTGKLGARRVWGGPQLRGPRLLHMAGGVPIQQADAVTAQYPKFSSPTGAAGVAETVTVGEYTLGTTGEVVMSRYGRWTDVTREALISADAGAISQIHRTAIAKDLDLALVKGLEGDAGSATSYPSDGVPAAILRKLAAVQDATGAEATECVVVISPEYVHLLQDVDPIGGRTIAEAFGRFAGAVVYPTAALTTNEVCLVGCLSAGARYFEAMSVSMFSEWTTKTQVNTITTQTIGGYGTGLLSGYVGAQTIGTSG